MNRQPFQTPPRAWQPQMTPWLVKLLRPMINRTLTKGQRITSIDVHGTEGLKRAIADGRGVLVTPNHAFHYDAYVMIEAAHRVGRPFHFLTAWQVFAMSNRYERFVLQRHGCFSINREGVDSQAFKTSVDILREGPHPLVIYPEGDIYHSNDRVTPFRDGAAAIAMSAAKKGPRPVVIVPAAVKSRYTQDPTPSLERLMGRLEESLHWRPRTGHPLHARIYQFAEGLLALKELEYLGKSWNGTIVERVDRLKQTILADLETKHAIPNKGGIIPERVKEVRRTVIKAAESPDLDPARKSQLASDMEDLFFIIQLFSYPGDYVAEKPSIERIAETLDKFEEDVLRTVYPETRGERHVTVLFGDPIEVPTEREGRDAVAVWTSRLESEVQTLLDRISSEYTSQ